ncbi:hypothetical protein TNCV_3643641 [Trichonephila clavipes]|nr:hypothetical protein TNCV_3643641 [Trichonephila clavipes]
MSSRRSLLRLPLTGNHGPLCCQWCEERRTWTTEWKDIVFTDESCLTMIGLVFGDTVGEAAELLRYALPHWSRTWYHGLRWYWFSLPHFSSSHCGYTKQPALHL